MRCVFTYLTTAHAEPDQPAALTSALQTNTPTSIFWTIPRLVAKQRRRRWAH
jgi:hypothetical protein